MPNQKRYRCPFGSFTPWSCRGKKCASCRTIRMADIHESIERVKMTDPSAIGPMLNPIAQSTKKPSVTRRKPLSPPQPETVSHAVDQSNALQNVLQLPGPASAAEPYLAQKIVEQHNQLQVGQQKLAQLQQYDLIEHQQEEQRQQKERMDQCFHQLTFQQQGQSLLLQQQLGKQLAPSPNQTTSPSFLEAYMYQAPLIPQVSSAMDARPTFAGAHGGGLASYFYSSTIVPQSPGALQESMINTPVQFEPQRTTTLPSRGIGSYRATFEQVPGYRPIQPRPQQTVTPPTRGVSSHPAPTIHVPGYRTIKPRPSS